MYQDLIVLIIFPLLHSSMFFDADQDLAHEFYEEASIKLPNGRIKLTMKRIKHNLQPQVNSH